MLCQIVLSPDSKKFPFNVAFSRRVIQNDCYLSAHKNVKTFFKPARRECILQFFLKLKIKKSPKQFEFFFV